ncbi:MAG: membrane protein insertion efficiency factor YidD [Lentisphaerae bacterium]|nr:membrane protein insertion efficiency factor YidD [Lentisphaerota bacterium]
MHPHLSGKLLCLCLLCTAGWAGGDMLQLQRELFKEQQWQDCRIECMRRLAERTDDYEARLLAALSAMHLDMDALPALAELGVNPDVPDNIRLPARFHQALLSWQTGDYQPAQQALTEVFTMTDDRELFAQAGCALAMTLRMQPRSWTPPPDITAQLQTASVLWTPELQDTTRQALQSPRTAGCCNPGRLLIGFYRTQIRPAIGDRCLMHPSCSEYTRQAFARHGFLLGIPIMADRFIREPDVIKHAQAPVIVGNKIFYADPLDNHDWWLETSPDH